MATFGTSDDLKGSTFTDVSLKGSRITASDVSGVVMRGVIADGIEIDSPWLIESGAALTVNGVDVTPFVDAELNRRFPGRELRVATDPAGLRDAWAALERTWAATVKRVAAMRAGTVDESVDGEWSFAQTLRHLVMATDTWLGKAVLQVEQPYHPLGMVDSGTASDGFDTSVFTSEKPSYADVLDGRASRVAMVRDFLATVTPEVLGEERKNPHAPQYPETVLSCIHTILEEEWEHHRYAVRDLDALTAKSE